MPSSSSVTKAKSAAATRAYFAALPPTTRRELKKIRDAVVAVSPDAVAVMSYGMPAFKLDGRILVYYAGWKTHTSIYPMTDAIRRAHARELKTYKTSKGTIQFPLDKPIPSALVKRLVKARVAELRANAKR